MSEEESKLVEEVVDTTGTTETKEEFNPLAFSEDVYGELDKTTEALEGAKEEVEGTESKEENEEDGWGWDSKKEEQQEEKKEEEYNWEDEDEAETVEDTEKSTDGLSWSDVGNELGLEITSKEEFLKTINAYAESMQQQADPVSNQITELRNYLSFSDRDLVAEELKADGIEASDIEDSLDKLEDSGMMKMKAKSIRRVIGNSIDQQTSQAKNEKEQNQQNQQKQATEAKQNLKKEIKNMNQFMGGIPHANRKDSSFSRFRRR